MAQKNDPKRPSRLRRLIRWTLGSAAAGLLALVAGTAALTPDCESEGCPTLATLEEYVPPEPPRVYDRRGDLVGQLPGPRRLLVELEEVPAILSNGFVAVEDRRFFRHDGVDVVGVLRAATRNVRAGGVEEGASTITMQLVRNVFEPEVHEYNRWRRKLTEARMALALEDRLTKHRILELYLNQIYLGGGVWGVETAARHFFGKSVSDLTPAEAALIVGLAKNPEGYNPRRHPERALERRAIVLGILTREGLLTPEEAEIARREELVLAPDPDAGEADVWYLAAVSRTVRELHPDPRTQQGLRVHTGYDPALQRAASREIADQIAAVEGGAYGPYSHDRPDGEIATDLRGRASPYLQGMAVALDPRTGVIRALVGGRDFRHSEFDRALQARRQPGSAFKPLVYSAAFDAGFTMVDTIGTDPVTVRRAGQAPWTPDDAGDGEPMTVREAVARSSNAAAVRVGSRVGLDRIADRARELGISTPIPRFPSVILGSAEVIPVELTAAYAVFGNGGRRVEPHLITRIEDRSGAIVWTPHGVAPTPVLDPGVAYLTLDALRGVVDGGTGWRVREAGYARPAAGKTGTTDQGKDAWFVGLTPEVAMAVWLGFDTPTPILPNASGGLLAAPVWGRIMAEVSDPEERRDGWQPPRGIVEAEVDRETGHLAGPYCPGEAVATEIFLRGTEPTLRCPVHEGDFFDKVVGGLKKIIGG